MTIDETITLLKINNKHISDLKNDDLQQLAEWLEELKSYRTSVFSGDMTQIMLKEEYNKAIDDFAGGLDYLLVKYAIENTLEPNIENVKVSLNYIKKIVSRIIEQLKAGGEND